MTYGHDGAQCPGMCPIQCPEDHMHCGGGVDATGCPMPDTCMPMTADCAAACPVHCPADHMTCPGGVMPTGCPMPDTCMPLQGNYQIHLGIIMLEKTISTLSDL